jgi:precorrin-6A/cobalt-precorrin-6A reductase
LVLEKALAGLTVALISGGDGGIYGITGIMLEIINQSGKTLPVEVIPGITALSAAQGDFVVGFYNPKSQNSYLRLERPPTPEVGAAVTRVADFTAAARRAADFNGNILLTTGSNHREVFVKAVVDCRRRLFVRVLPTSTVLRKCEDLGLTAKNIIALQGPFTETMNLEMIRYCQAGVVVTKDSGAKGGGDTKLAVARRLKVPVVMVARPPISCQPTVGSVEAVMERITQLLL